MLKKLYDVPFKNDLPISVVSKIIYEWTKWFYDECRIIVNHPLMTSYDKSIDENNNDDF